MAGFTIRFHHKFNLDQVAKAVQDKAHATDSRFGLERTFQMEPFFTDPNSPFVQYLVRMYGEEVGQKGIEPVSTGGATETRVLTGEYRAAFGPTAVGKRTAHAPNEGMSLEDIHKVTGIYLRAMTELLNQPK